MKKNASLILAFALVALIVAFSFCGCAVDKSWQPQKGETITKVYEKLGYPTEIIYTELYWRTPDGRNEFYVKLDRCPEFKGWKVVKGDKVDQVIMLPEAYVVDFAWTPHGR